MLNSYTKYHNKLTSETIEVVKVNPTGQIISRFSKIVECYSENLGNGIAISMVKIPGGTFHMGSKTSEFGHRSDEIPIHQVTVPAFYMSKYPITQQQWKAVARLRRVDGDLNRERRILSDDRFPIERVSWYDAVEFCERLSRFTGRFYRLPSEAEWEYACRATTKTPFHFGETLTQKLANCDAKYTKTIKKEKPYTISTVGSYFPNSFGLYDMHGLVWEWCADDYNNNYEDAPHDGTARVLNNDSKSKYKVLRGGCWYHEPRFCRSAMRNYNSPSLSYNGIGFRIVMACF
ncbi:MAG: formylglycine-generating enzyme family protein [Prochloraceae cyanobacterium]|nr:formylglycine-generating enzyme family protein [Prochloraceae cyanobacterium]